MTDEQIVRVCAENKIALTPNEARQVEALLGRAPTLTEAIIWGFKGVSTVRINQRANI